MSTNAQTTEPIILTPLATVGCYYRDADGNPWSTFHMTGGHVVCLVCGARITNGYVRGVYGNTRRFCAAHVTISQRGHTAPAFLLLGCALGTALCVLPALLNL